MKFIELIVVENILIHLSFVKIANYILRVKSNVLTIVSSCILDGVYICLYLLIPYEIEKYQYVFIFFISIVPFITKGVIKSLMLCIVYLMLNFTLGGSAGILFRIINNQWSVVISLIGIYIIFLVYSFYKKYHFRPDVLEYDILIEDRNQILKLKGFCDTGNFLCLDDNIPVVFVNKKIIVGEFYKYINVNSVSTSSYIPIYKVKCFKLKIDKKYIKKDVYIAFSDIAFDVMFGACLLGG